MAIPDDDQQAKAADGTDASASGIVIRIALVLFAVPILLMLLVKFVLP
jgi:hypothetical protein